MPNLEILIIDDSDEKVQEIAEVINSSNEGQSASLSRASDLFSARRMMESVAFDIVVLDVNLPARADEEATPNACEAFLIDISRNPRIKFPGYLVGLTAFENVFEKCNSIFSSQGWLLFNTTLHKDTWPKVLLSRIAFLASTGRTSNSGSEAAFGKDIAFVTALATPEFGSILNWPVQWKTIRRENDFVEYYESEIDNGPRKLTIVAASCQHMGNVSAATLSLKIAQAFRPKILIMVGICAGVRGRTNIGDVLVCEESWDYNSGKLGKSDSQRTFEPDPKSIRITPEMCQIFQNAERTSLWAHKAFNKWRGRMPNERPQFRIGPVASGSSVVADSEKVREISNQNRKLLGLEMEAYGVYFAALNSWTPKPQFLSLKSVCDFADSTKEDGFQSFAAHMSSEVIFEIVSGGFLDPILDA